MSETSYGAKKSFYLLLTSILGALLFFILHRVVVFLFLYALASGALNTTVSYWRFTIYDQASLALVLLLGAWYGIWVGMYWFQKVYEEKNHWGVIHHMAVNYWPNKKPSALTSKVAVIRHRLENDLWQLEDLAKTTVRSQAPAIPIKRKVVRKRAPKKLNSL